MDHPIRSESNKSLRARVVNLFKNAFMVRRQSNIIFVCGGNAAADMRPRFEKAFANILPEFEFFEPEFAMNSYFSLGVDEQFDIADFEELVAQLSHAIVLFPEGPGSFAEAGYFAAIEPIAKKTILAIDSSRQKKDSFLSLGPAKKIQAISEFHPNIQIDYKNPDFQIIADRIRNRKPLKHTKKAFVAEKFSSLPEYEVFCLIEHLIDFLGISTPEDIEFLLKAVFKNRIQSNRIRKIISILHGSKRIKEVGDFGHLTSTTGRSATMDLKDGFVTEEQVLRIEISAMALSSEAEFINVYEAAQC